jgi:soluble lytic murein transglycosylase-like protein
MTLLHACTLLVTLITTEARRQSIPPPLALAVAHVESRCVPAARNPSGAQGVFQVMPFWTRAFTGRLAQHCGGTDLTDPMVNTCYGVFILRHYAAQCRGNWACALRRYSGNHPDYLTLVRARLREGL